MSEIFSMSRTKARDLSKIRAFEARSTALSCQASRDQLVVGGWWSVIDGGRCADVATNARTINHQPPTTN
jgi:hypothetical protein